MHAQRASQKNLCQTSVYITALHPDRGASQSNRESKQALEILRSFRALPLPCLAFVHQCIYRTYCTHRLSQHSTRHVLDAPLAGPCMCVAALHSIPSQKTKSIHGTRADHSTPFACVHASRDTRRNVYSAAHLYVGLVVVMMVRGDLGRPSLWSSTRLGAVDERLIVSRIPVL